MGIVAALLPNPARLFRLRAAIRGRHAVEACTDWAAVTRLCEEQPVHLAVLDVFSSGSMSLEPLRQLKRRFPRLSTVVYVDASAERAHDLFDAGRSGVDGLIVADRDDDARAMAVILEQAEARGVAAQLRTAMGQWRPLVRDAVLIAVTRAHERLTTDTVTRTLSVSRRILARQLADASLPTPQRLLTWGRLIVAGHLLEDTERSADGVAYALHFPSGSAFRNTCQRYLKATPSEIRANGGAGWVINRFLSPESHEGLVDEEHDEVAA